MEPENLLDALPANLPKELFDPLLKVSNVRIERIVSHGHVSRQSLRNDLYGTECGLHGAAWPGRRHRLEDCLGLRRRHGPDDRCQNCGTWIERAVPSALAGQGQESGPASEEPAPEPNSLEGQVLALMQGQKKIKAIKLYREQTGAGLKQAKDAVEALAAKHGISQGKGCAGMVLLMVVVSTIIVVGLWVLPG